MQKRIAAAFCLAFSCLTGKSLLAKTSKLALGVDLKTTILTKKNDAFQDYMAFRDFHHASYLLRKEANELLEFSKFPIVVGVNLGYGFNFTNKFGLACHLGFEKGNLTVISLSEDNAKELFGSNVDSKYSKDFPTIRLSTLGANFDIRVKYDLLNSSLDFDDYGRNGILISASLGFKLNWLFSRDLTNSYGLEKKDDQRADNANNKDKGKVEVSKRFSSWFPGLVLGVDVVFPFNLGLGVEGSWYFTNLFRDDQEIKDSDEKWRKEQRIDQAMKNGGPAYNIKPLFFQVGLNIFYDFAPFCANHEAPSEIDIEKW